jgi:hypothetical protein
MHEDYGDMGLVMASYKDGGLSGMFFDKGSQASSSPKNLTANDEYD